MSDKIPYSKVNKTSVTPSTGISKKTKSTTLTQNGKGCKPRPYSNMDQYLNNYDEINWG